MRPANASDRIPTVAPDESVHLLPLAQMTTHELHGGCWCAPAEVDYTPGIAPFAGERYRAWEHHEVN